LCKQTALYSTLFVSQIFTVFVILTLFDAREVCKFQHNFGVESTFIHFTLEQYFKPFFQPSNSSIHLKFSLGKPNNFLFHYHLSFGNTWAVFLVT